MLTPIEIQGITFKNGRGYKKEDVDSFMKALHHDCEIMYKENMELKEKVTTLSDGIQYYKNLEKTLQKALVLAEKTSEETKEAAQKNAEVIEKKAKVNAEKIIYDARQEYDKMQLKTRELLQNFELYKTQFKQLVNTQIELLQSSAFEIQLHEYNIADEENSKPVEPDIKSVLDIDKVEVQATDEEMFQAEQLAKQIFEEEETKTTAVEEDTENNNADSEKPDMDVNSDTQEEVAVTQTSEDELEKIEEKLSEENQKSTEQEEKEPANDDKTDLEIRMLQKLLNEIKKNNEPDTSDEEFEFINTDTDE